MPEFVRPETYADNALNAAYVFFGLGLLVLVVGFVLQTDQVSKNDEKKKKAGWYSAAAGVWLLSVAGAVIWSMNSACPTSAPLQSDMTYGLAGGAGAVYPGGGGWGL